MNWFKYIATYILSFLLLFTLGRILFVLVNGIAIDQLLAIFWNALKLDISTISYLILLPLILLVFTQHNWVKRSLKIYSILAFTLAAVVCIADPFFFHYWGLKSNLLFLEYTSEGKDGFLSIQWTDVFIGLISIVLSIYLFVRFGLNSLLKNRSYPAIHLLYLIPVVVIAARGGLSGTPINISSAYFSSDQAVNNASVNPLWNLLQYELENENVRSVGLLSKQEVDQLWPLISKSSDTSVFDIEYTDSTKLILILLESFSSKVCGAFGGEYDVTPNLNALANEGIIFTNAYASSFRSDRALTAVMTGTPTLARHNLTHYPNLLAKRPNLFRIFNDNGWNTSFFYGGDLNFANIKFLFNEAEVQRTGKDFLDYPSGVWGAHDEYVFSEFAEYHKKLSSPSFSILYSLSSHEPFKIEGYNKHSDPYLNSISYTDFCLGELIKKLKANPSWKNTIVMITADHGTTLPEHSSAYLPQNYKVPLLLIGGAIEKDTVITEVVSQLDIPLCLLNGMGDPKEWMFSSDLQHPRDMAFYTYYNGLSCIRTDSANFFDIPLNKYFNKDMKNAYEKAFYQKAAETFFAP